MLDERFVSLASLVDDVLYVGIGAVFGEANRRGMQTNQTSDVGIPQPGLAWPLQTTLRRRELAELSMPQQARRNSCHTTLFRVPIQLAVSCLFYIRDILAAEAEDAEHNRALRCAAVTSPHRSQVPTFRHASNTPCHAGYPLRQRGYCGAPCLSQLFKARQWIHDSSTVHENVRSRRLQE